MDFFITGMVVGGVLWVIGTVLERGELRRREREERQQRERRWRDGQGQDGPWSRRP